MIDNYWKPYLEAEFAKPYMAALRDFLQTEKNHGKIILPHSKHWFCAFAKTDFPDVKVVILGQDPYHGLGQAHGLSFSVPKNVPPPPSLRNIFKEVADDVGYKNFSNGDLTHWATQGVLLLNSVLTVEQAKAGSHAGQGWEQFTDAMIANLNQHREHLVFLLWGSYAQQKGALIDTTRHLVLQAPHPSPLSAYRGFFGCKHFSQTNAYLLQHQSASVRW